MTKKNNIDFDNVPDIRYSHVFIVLEDDIKQRLLTCVPILERFENGLKFIQMIGSENSEGFNSALIRTALTELVAIEDLQKTLRNKGVLINKPYRLFDAQSPLLSIAREMRNLELHLSSSTFSSEKRDLLWGRIENITEAMQVSRIIMWVDNLYNDRFFELNNVKDKYDFEEFSNALRWFDSQQRQWGIVELLFRAYCLYAEKLANYHSF